MAMGKRPLNIVVRNAVFGVEDGLVSTVGFLAGIAAADVPRKTLFLSGLVLIVVEALSMGVGSILAEETVEELRLKNADGRTALVGGGVMFVSYFLAGLVPLGPYLMFPGREAFALSILVSFLFLFMLGLISGRVGKGSPVRSALRMLLLGGLAIAAGVAVGRGLRMD